MTTDFGSLQPGIRVVLRYRLPPGRTHSMTDVIGTLEATGPMVRVRSADGREVEVAPERVVALKPVGPRPVRTSEIRAVEHASALAWPGLEQEWIGGWLARAGAGFSHRANSAIPLTGSPLRGPGALADLADERTLQRIEQWYAVRGLPALLQLPDRLASVPVGWVGGPVTSVMVAALSSRPVAAARPRTAIATAPDESWLSAYHHRGDGLPVEAPSVIAAVRGGCVGFGKISDDQGAPLAIARVAVTAVPDGVLRAGLGAVEVAPAARRRHLATTVCEDMLDWARHQGAASAYLQVAEGNEAALGLYRSLGFADHHRYRYARRDH